MIRIRFICSVLFCYCCTVGVVVVVVRRSWRISMLSTTMDARLAYRNRNNEFLFESVNQTDDERKRKTETVEKSAYR